LPFYECVNIGEQKYREGGSNMPNYEFKCQKCNKKFSLALSLKEREEGKYKCPKCGGRKSQPIFGNFYAKTSKKG
jgi:putative FmdB family regulatory protein